MDLFLIIALLIIVSAIYSYINARFLKLPGTIGIVTLAILGSVLTLIIDSLNPNIAKHLTALAKNINFSTTVLNIMLGFLLFATAFNLDTRKLRKEMRPVLILSTLGVIISTTVFGALFYWITGLIAIKVPFIYCLLFGALVSPTDPVAVAAIIKGSKLPANLETIISGESLFNDGVGLVLFLLILEVAQSGVNNLDIGKAVFLFVQEVFGGVILGAVTGWLAFRLMKSINDFQTIVLVSLALVMLDSVLAAYFHLSIPLAVVTAGLFVGGRSINADRKERSHEALEKFWLLIDEILNAVLFVMIGLQMVNVPFISNYWITGGIAIIIILGARWMSIMLPLTFLRRSLHVNYSSINILTWAGLRGGISIALALALPASPYRHLILSGSYFIVIFSIIVQGLTLNKLINLSFNKN
ncbi:cation:proton antiporter [Mucilaginibacter phyllosphaerae]|uniref:CPA1 family monovalent cation:H+ antiporter n=1 Tax=Mucilaginibacter phyllosphaerae TaxID=1812349 RepID=A0A4Y8AC14_9SPHI|nr:sodium:proton antiporter [Mucilaginibacter phyllosphaerae]MBB3969131.1 CPA1 family monovalent cation:H+ antiporter [Mucilaginibacter phyllosphaerae]TEW66055.1 sodium:proton antiporter [Mucilaginibacter phyllosphaerae]GGH06517.1 sodium:proton antiporter [Mucilaginibacter phyllosphaerae]